MICIIGAGLAGDSAAATLRAEGYSGRILLIGAEPDAPYDRPPLSKEVLVDEVPFERLLLRPAGWYADQDIELKLAAAVVEIDPAGHRITLANGESVAYDKLLLATGSRARSLPGTESATLPSFVVRTLSDARALRAELQPGKRMAIVGAGVIGLEVAASAIRRGCEVDVVDLADRVLSRVVSAPLSRYMAALHTANGTRLHLSAGEVIIAAGGLDTEAWGHIAADAVVVGIGVIPNDELARAAGLECRDGVIVDENARTSDPDIFAVGDVARYPCPFGGGLIRCENWKHAQNHAATAARAMIGRPEPYVSAPSMWSDQFGVKLQTVGSFHGEEIRRGDDSDPKFMLLYRDGAGVLVGAIGVNQAKDMRFAQLLIEKRAVVDVARLADPKQDFRKLVA